MNGPIDSRCSVVRFVCAAAVVCTSLTATARADEMLIFNPTTYMVNGRLVLNPTPDMIVWDGGSAHRIGAGMWVGSGWSRFPGGQGSLSTRMLEDDVMPESKARPRRRISTTCSCDCENALLMWSSSRD
jgi:hypothetical protein